MQHSTETPLAVSIQELAPVRVAYIDCQVNLAEGGYSSEIARCFQQVKDWVADQGLDVKALLTIGVIEEVDGRPAGYACCVQVPPAVTDGLGAIGIQELTGGRYAVVTIEKDPAIIGDALRRFYQEYVPQTGLAIDGARPTYEVYYEHTLDYCVPIR
ncbi:MAG: GyrI-like domain-containing protein [Chloroflexi bacterium]|nr:GyrI-like domain-containing protein [Chloroflexota bacterium]MBU1748573.1 GyrI-like domain-containing protein [Chloroflexota bacterium]MBU1880328.1 GyrI-like domain-containing protein [Chloroflexota bacterium]